MVSVRGDQVYGAVTYQWEKHENIRKRLRRELCIDQLNWLQKVGYALTLTYWNVSTFDIIGKLASLEDQDLIESRMNKNTLPIPRNEYRKKASGKTELADPRLQTEGLGYLLSTA
ncbi:MAG: hypothetical protein AABY10_00380 [Nanoarchaeota archaeon]